MFTQEEACRFLSVHAYMQYLWKDGWETANNCHESLEGVGWDGKKASFSFLSKWILREVNQSDTGA